MQIQAKSGIRELILLGAAAVSLAGCQARPRASVEDAVARARDGLAEQVNPPGEGLPFHTVRTLNPIWSEAAGPIVRMPKMGFRDQSGLDRDSSILEGKATFVGFFFTTCRGFCPIVIHGMRDIEKSLKGGAGGARFVAITVDPEHDDPARLREYAAKMGLDTSARGRWTLLTGDRAAIHSLVRDTLASQTFQRATKNERERNFVHSEHVYLFDGRSRLRAVLNGTRVELAAEAAAAATELLRGPARKVAAAKAAVEVAAFSPSLSAPATRTDRHTE